MKIGLALWCLIGLYWGASASAYAAEMISKSGLYFVKLEPLPKTIVLNELHSWNIHIERRDQGRVSLREILIDGGMPDHGHDLPTKPVVVFGDKAGDFKLNGVLFNMNGTWEIRLLIVDHSGTDLATFSFDIGSQAGKQDSQTTFSENERATLKSLILSALPAAPRDPSNAVADNIDAVALGHRLFFDPGLSKNKNLSCASCHNPAKYFGDGRAVARGVQNLERNTPSVVGLAHSKWMFWDGRRDSLWSQALFPLEAKYEMANNRLAIVRYVTKHPDYRPVYEKLFGPLPKINTSETNASPVGSSTEQLAWAKISASDQEGITRAFANIGKLIAAYERQLLPGESSFDRYAKAVLADKKPLSPQDSLSPEAISGLKIFLSSEAQCIRCHNGPLFTNGGFHNIGTGQLDGERPDFGRSLGIQALYATEFSCKGPYNDNPTKTCPDHDFLNRHNENGNLVGAYKVPSLRNISKSGPYMHDGRFRSLTEVVDYYRDPGPGTSATLEFMPLVDMTPNHVKALVEFLKSLEAPASAAPDLLKAPQQSKISENRDFVTRRAK